MRDPTTRSRPLFALLVLLAACSLGAAAAPNQKLILKDGSDQIVREYEVIGDRVRYYSTEREDWEELPADLVDWDATNKAKEDAQRAAQAAVEEAAQPEPRTIAPGLVLPESEGVYAFDGKSLTLIPQSEGFVDNDDKRTILGALAPIPGIVKGHAWIKLRGANAKTAIATNKPVFYIQLSHFASSYGIVKANQKGSERVVADISITPFTNDMSESRDLVPGKSEEVFPAENGELAVLRLAPTTPLAPGEYALIEMVDTKKQNLFVWDFRVPAPSQGATRQP